MNKLFNHFCRYINISFIFKFFCGRAVQKFDNSHNYWDRRYKSNRSSGAGSYGRLASFKADLLNNFVIDNSIKSVIEFGCGDGNQLSLAEYPNYLGVDVSETAISICKNKFQGANTKEFIHSSIYNGQSAELALSLDVIYHLVEDQVYECYMNHLFDSAERFVIIYSSNMVADSILPAHIKHRLFSQWVDKNRTDFKLISKVKNIYPYSKQNPENTSFCDFYIYKKIR